ncbi:MAG: DUF2628 domain-containing protein [Hyphomicrobiaceae bacterium]|nr:DUF2628 domain-containing protein [Hyphomicrobiaceae bacterium]
MAIYTVYSPPDTDSVAGAERAVFIRDDFALFAFIAPVLWLLWHRMWLVLVLYLGLWTVAAFAAALTGNVVAFIVVTSLASLWLAIEARGLRGWTLLRRGWRLASLIDADDVDAAEIRYFASLAGRLAPPPLPLPPGAPVFEARKPAPASVVGLFPAAGGRQ